MSNIFIPGKTVEVPDIPYKDKVVLPRRKTALLVLDMQNDFVKPEGRLVVPAAKETIPNIKRLVDAARSAAIPVVFFQDTHQQADPEWSMWPEHCRQGTWGWNIVDELKPRPDELVCQKNRYDGFYGTWLEHYLGHVWKVEHLVITGTVSNICVLYTASSAGMRWYHVVVPADGISALTEFDQALTLRQISNLFTGEVVKSVQDIQFD